MITKTWSRRGAATVLADAAAAGAGVAAADAVATAGDEIALIAVSAVPARSARTAASLPKCLMPTIENVAFERGVTWITRAGDLLKNHRRPAEPILR
jgi:hypothetical protein